MHFFSLLNRLHLTLTCTLSSDVNKTKDLQLFALRALLWNDSKGFVDLNSNFV